MVSKSNDGQSTNETLDAYAIDKQDFYTTKDIQFKLIHGLKKEQMKRALSGGLQSNH